MAERKRGDRANDDVRRLTDKQADYERRRAKAAGLTLDAWMARKARTAAASAAAAATPGRVDPPARKGLIGRLLDRAHKPI